MTKIVDVIVKQGPESGAPAPSVRRRRSYSRAFKAEVVAQCMAPGASVSGIALSHGINANVVRSWLPASFRTSTRAPVLLPVSIRPETAASAPAASTAIELCLLGATVRLPCGFDPQDLRSIVQILRAKP